MQWLTSARTERAPFSRSSFAAEQSVPAVSVMSSTRMMLRPSTSPTRFVDCTVVAETRRFATKPSGRSSRFATALAAFMPPTSGENTVASFRKGLSLM